MTVNTEHEPNQTDTKNQNVNTEIKYPETLEESKKFFERQGRKTIGIKFEKIIKNKKVTWAKKPDPLFTHKKLEDGDYTYTANNFEAIAMVHGPISKTYTLDIDYENKTPSVEEALNLIFDDPAAVLDLTLVSKSPKQGVHITFESEDGVYPPQKAYYNKKYPGVKIDIRSTHGYTLVPPSNHPEKKYGKYLFVSKTLIPAKRNWSKMEVLLAKRGFFTKDQIEGNNNFNKYNMKDLIAGNVVRGDRRTNENSYYIKLRKEGISIEMARTAIFAANEKIPEPLDDKEVQDNLRQAENHFQNEILPDMEKSQIKSQKKTTENESVAEKEEEEEKEKDSNKSDIIKEFFQDFKDENSNSKYVKLIEECKDSIILNVADLSESDSENNKKMYGMLLNEPKKFLKIASGVTLEIFKEKHPKSTKKNIFIHVDEVSTRPSIKKILGNKLIGKMVTVSGMITSVALKYNVPDFIIYTCPDGHLNKMMQSQYKGVAVPIVCDNKQCKHRDFEAKGESSEFEQYKLITLKSNTDFSLSGDDLYVLLSNDMVDSVDVGENVQITGFVETRVVETRQKLMNAIYRNKIVCSSVKKIDEIDYKITPEDIEEFEKLIEDENFYKKLINSVTPSVHGLSHVKESMLLMLVGSDPRIKSDGTSARGNIIVGSWGGSGLAKTKFGEWLDSEIPRTKIIHSGGATEAGLLLGLEDNPHGNGKILCPGAFVYCSDGGIVIMDEYIHTNKDIRNGLLTTLESGFASIAKSGHNAKVRADASLYATGNAFEDEWDEHATLATNLDMKTRELQRFDYHWIILDKFSRAHDEKVGRSIMFGAKYESDEKPFSAEFLYKYSKYLQKFKPEIKEGEAGEYLLKAYLDLRQDESAKQSGISARHLNTMIRTAIIIAKIHQHDEITVEDVDKAISLMQKMLSQQNISIDDTDNYLTHQSQRVIRILKDVAPTPLTAHELFYKLREVGNIEEIALSMEELGDISSLESNGKWRAVIIKLKTSPRLNTIGKKPLRFAYKVDLGDMSQFM